MKRAFTLIELLVVIAIIAILAAILFPVFAQAKAAAKKTATLSNFKQTGTAVNIYLSDSDDTFPLQCSYDSTGASLGSPGWRWNFLYIVPNGSSSSATRNVEPRKSEEGAVVLNSMQPYMKNTEMLAASGLSTYAGTFVQATNAPKMAQTNVTFNGILSSWSATAVAQPSKLPVFWQGAGDENLTGNISTPALDCSRGSIAGAAPYPCMFNPGGMPNGTAATSGYGYNWYYWGSHPTKTSVYGNSSIYVAADSSAKVRNWAALPKWPQYAALNVNDNPFSANDPGYPAATPYWITDCVSPGATKGTQVFYPGFFRPDSEYNYTATQCDSGGG